jgi:hypothetical protein
LCVLGAEQCGQTIVYPVRVHLRPPSLDPGLVAGLWGIGLGLYVALGSFALGVGRAESFILGGLAAAGIFVYVRLYGEAGRRRRPPSARRS